MCLNLFAKTIYVDRPVEVIKEVPVYPDLDDFENENDLEAWFDKHSDFSMSSDNLCDDYARESRDLARKDGKYLGIALVWEGKVYNTPVFPDPNDPSVGDKTVFHVGNTAVCKKENTAWYVDLAFKKIMKLCNFYSGGKY